MALADNWRASTGVFVSQKDGDNVTGTGSKANPYKDFTYNSVLSGTHNIRGTYYNFGNLPTVVNTISRLNGDGQVILSAAGFSELIDMSRDSYLLFNNIKFENTIQLSSRSSSTRGAIGIINCIFKNTSFDYQRGQDNSPSVDLKKSEFGLFLNSNLRLYRSNLREDYVIFRHTFNSSSTFFSVNNNALLQFCAFEQGASYTALSGDSCLNCAFGADGGNQVSIEGVNIKDIILDGDADTIGNSYADGQKFSGVATLIGGTATVSFTDCFWSADLGFNNPNDEDYTLKDNSLLINDLAIIGFYGVATRFDSQSPAFDPLNLGVSYTDAIRNIDGSFTFNDPVGQVVSTNDPAQCLTLPFPTLVRNAVRFFGSFLYNQGDWLDTENYDSGINDEVRLTVRVQIYDENEPNGSNNPNNFSDWLLIEAQTAFEVDENGLGNGNVDANMQNLAALTFERFRIELTGRTNGI